MSNINYIYSSLFTRCIESAIETQNVLKKKLGRLVLIS